VRSKSIGGPEDWVAELVRGGFPNAEMEVMDSEDQVVKEWGSLESYHWSVIAFTLIGLSNIFSKLGCIL
jgi:hypothetical protein